MSGLIIGLLVAGAGSLAIYSYMNVGRKNKKDVFEDYLRIKSAVANYKKANTEFPSSIQQISVDGVDLTDYKISSDGKYLVVDNLPEDKQDYYVKKVGGSSYMNHGLVYLSFLSLNKISAVDAQAVITISPNKEITTNTQIEYSFKDSIVEDGEIIEARWENNKKRFSKPGIYEVKLRVKDKNGNWSPWTKEEIEVTEKKGIAKIATGRDSIFVVYNNGHVASMGGNSFGELADGTTENSKEISVLETVDNVWSIAAGEHHSLFLLHDRTVEAAGFNGYGQLGNGTRKDSLYPKTVWGLDDIKQIDCGYHFSGALNTFGEVYVWGSNEFNQVSEEKILYREMPRKLDDVDQVKQISLGATHGLALRYDGTVIGWGDNSYGQLGLGFKGKTNPPTMTEFKNVKRVVAGDKFSLAITDTGKVFVCGHNNKFQLGIPGKKEVLFPEEILDLKAIVYAHTKGNHVVAMDDIGRVYAWGTFNSSDTKPIQKPAKVGNLKYVKSLMADHAKGYALLEDDKVAVFGPNLVISEELEIPTNENIVIEKEDTTQ